MPSTWKLINSVISKGDINVSPKSFLINNNQCTDPIIIASELNKFFTNIGPNLAKKIPSVNKNLKDYFHQIAPPWPYAQ